MRVLALDYGSARCGCAVCDPSGTIVTPIEVVERPAGKRGMARLRALVAERGVEMVLVGLPLALDGHDTAQTTEARAFAKRMASALGEAIPVRMHDERFTTRMAQRTPGKPSTSEDSRAAAHLLESWLAAQDNQQAG